MVVSWKLNFFENLCLKDELKAQVLWLLEKNIYFECYSQRKTVKKGFNWRISIQTYKEWWNRF